MNTAWKTVRIFISSTFLDMQAERDHLVRFVFPRLRENLLPHRIHLVDVDLRWGVISGQDALEVCREIIDECHPRFLCILGGRYGWTPPEKDRSITADEVHFGVLDRTLKDRGFAYFYFRDEAATSAMVERSSGEFREPQDSINQKKLIELKQKIVDAGLDPFVYHPHWDNISRRLVGLADFGHRVYDDLLAGMKSDPALQDRFRPDTAIQLDEFAEENAAMEAFVEEHSEQFVLGSRELEFKELLAHASSIGGNNYVCLTGAPGSGKSALLANLGRHPTLSHQQSAIFIQHFVGSSPGSSDVRRTMRRFCHELKMGSPEITADIPDDPQKLRIALQEFLRQACANKRVVILLDAVNQFDQALNFAQLSWLPEDLPSNARIILSAFSGPALDDLRRRIKPREIELNPLTTADGEAIIEQFLKRYRKELEPDQRNALLNKADAGTPLFLRAALEELRTLGTHKEITGRIAQLPPTTQELFAWIFERLENDVGFRDAAGRQVGHELVSRFAAILGASLHGLSPSELADLLDAGDPQGNVATLLHLLRPYLMRRGELLDFYHGQLKSAAEERALGDKAERRKVHKVIADYFEKRWSSPSAHHALQELPYQLTKAEDWAGVERVLCNLQFIEMKCASGMGHDLLEDYKFARLSSSAASACLHHLAFFHDLFQSELHVLSNRPEYVFQQFNDRLQWFQQQDSVIDNIICRAERQQRTRQNRWIRNEFQRSGAQMTLVGHEARVTSCAGLPEGQLLASGDAAGRLRLWSTADGDCRAVVDTGGPIRKLLVCGGKAIVVLNENGLILVCPLNVETGQLSGELTDDIAVNISANPGGSVLIAYKSGRLGTVVDTGFDLRDVQCDGLPGQTAAISFAPSREYQESPIYLIAHGQSIVLLHRGNECAKYNSEENIRMLQVSPDGKWLAADTPNNIFCFKLSESLIEGELKPSTVISRKSGINFLSEVMWISHERLLWIRRQPHIYNAMTGLCDVTLRQFFLGDAQCGCPVGSETVAIGRENGNIELWRLSKPGPSKIYRTESSPVVACFPGTSQHEITSVLKDGRIVQQGEKGGIEIGQIPTAHGSPVCAAFEPITHSIVVGTDQGHVLSTGAELSRPITQLYSHRREILKIEFSPDSRLLATSARDREIIISRWEEREILSILARHRRRVTGFAWHPNSRQLFSTSTDRTIRVWDAVNGSELLTCKSADMLLDSLAIDPLGLELVCCDYNKTIMRFDVKRIWEFINLRGQGCSPGHAFVGNSKDAFAFAVGGEIDMPLSPNSPPWTGDSQCEYIAAGVLAYAQDSEPVVLLDVNEDTIVATFDDGGLFDTGEIFTPRFYVDKGNGVVLRGTSEGRAFVWNLPDEFSNRRSSLRGSVRPSKPANWEIGHDAGTLITRWADGTVTIL
ncbi:MAG: DUF4062 domain-containing protein, partial [Candidatus Eisenbacteria bacterium]|nr:DUF4062 domain-containing protein [Candidatus Eisenbacteria bacterium]